MPAQQPPEYGRNNSKAAPGSPKYSNSSLNRSDENWQDKYQGLNAKKIPPFTNPSLNNVTKQPAKEVNQVEVNNRAYKPLIPQKPEKELNTFKPSNGQYSKKDYLDESVSPSRIDRQVHPYTQSGKSSGRFRSFLVYGGVTTIVVGIIVLLYLITRVSTFVSGVTVPRIDQNGAAVLNSSLGSGRVNILLLGLDVRPTSNDDGTRSDTMILVSVDQGSKTASMLSIPRDLWVEIPGHGSNRINTAYFFGELDKPGTGGPPLAKATVSNFLGLKVDYFVQVDFGGFRKIVDAIGGVTLDVKKPLVDNEFPTEDYGTKRIYIPAGIQRMDGETALEYARSRHSDSDLGRNQRQQSVLLAVREQGINLGVIGNNNLQTALQSAFKTDLQAGDIFQLLQSAIGMSKDNIKSFSIDANLTRQANVEGNDVLLPDKPGIKNLVSQILNAAPAQVKETANISILNGTFVQGLASRTQKFLEGKSYTITNLQQAPDAGKYPHSVIRVYNGKQKTALELAALIGLPAGAVQIKTGGPAGIDIEIICGDDYKVPG